MRTGAKSFQKNVDMVPNERSRAISRFSTARENKIGLRARSTTMAACTNQNINSPRDGQNNDNITFPRPKFNADSNDVIVGGQNSMVIEGY